MVYQWSLRRFCRQARKQRGNRNGCAKFGRSTNVIEALRGMMRSDCVTLLGRRGRRAQCRPLSCGSRGGKSQNFPGCPDGHWSDAGSWPKGPRGESRLMMASTMARCSRLAGSRRSGRRSTLHVLIFCRVSRISLSSDRLPQCLAIWSWISSSRAQCAVLLAAAVAMASSSVD